MRKNTLMLLVLLMFLSSALFAGTTGKIVGRVINAKTKKPIQFAHVGIAGTDIGTTTNDKGKFSIINVDPGTYSIMCTLMGYRSVQQRDVIVSVDETTSLRFRLETVSTGIQGIDVVKAKEKKIKKGRTSSTRTITSTSLEDGTTDDLVAILATQAGAHKGSDGELHVRGGQGNEVQYTIDGMSVSDPVDGGSALSVDTDAIATMNVITGGLPAEYGNAQSGMVNVVTKSGTKFYHGKIEANSDHIFSEADNEDEIKFNFGGPLLGYGVKKLRSNLTFFLNGGAKWTDSRFRDYYISDANDELMYLSNPLYTAYDPYKKRDSFLIFDKGNRNFSNYSINLKTLYKLNVTTKFTLAVRGSRSLARPYAHNWKYSLENYFESENNMRQYILTFDKVYGSAFNIKIKGSYFEKESNSNPIGLKFEDFYYKKEGYDEASIIDNIENNNAVEITELDGIAGLDFDQNGILDYKASDWEYSLQGEIEGKSVSALGFLSPGSYSSSFVNDKTQTISLRTDATYQLNNIHEIKSGFEYIQHIIKKDQISSPAVIDFNKFYTYLKQNATPVKGVGADGIEGTDDDIEYWRRDDRLRAVRNSVGVTDGYEAKPIQFAYYLQDKMEWEGMIINAGLRFDFWYLGKDYKVKAADGTFFYKEFDKDDRLKLNVSPRLGISHPISERDVLRFSYNYQNQLPSMKYIFTTKTPEDALTSNGVQIGNPNLDPQLTITYEVGLQHQISDIYVMDVSAYYKNTYNYISQKEYSHPESPSATYTQFISKDYGSAQGIDFSLTRSLSDFISGSLSYSLSWARGNYKSTNSVVSESDEDLREYPLDWDSRHSFNLGAEFRVQDDEDFIIPFTDYVLPFDDFAVNMLYHIASGTPYTPINEDDQVLERNSENKEYTTYTDVKFVKNFKFGSENSELKVKVYLEISNIFDTENQVYVYSKTGNTYDDGNDNPHEDNQTHVTNPESKYIRDLFLKNPAMTSSGRSVVLGMSYNF